MVRRIGRIGRSIALGLAVMGMVMAAGAQAQDKAGEQNRMLTGVNVNEIISILTDNEIQAQQAPVPGNDPVVLAMLPSGAKFFVNLQGCEEKGTNCQVVRYGAIFTGAELSMPDYNAFNSLYVFGKAYQGPDSKMYIHHAVSVAGGIRRGAVEINMFVFFRMAEFFTKFISERLSSLSASLGAPAGGKPGAITNTAGELPANSLVASFNEAAKKHPEIINKVSRDGVPKWKLN